ncbi:MAG TPA: cytochrome c [Candidatus Bathyarchaeia archaeon]|nr:cytochrome c [Candidatus Bathyarchaeia archaeon]
MRNKNAIFLGIAGISLGVFLVTQGNGIARAQDPTLKVVSISQSKPDSGAQMYLDYCASCHGRDGRGNGPAASALKVPAADLTTLAKNNHGNYPSSRVGAVLEFGAPVTAHGSSDMPVWGDLFRSLNTGKAATSRAAVNQRISSLDKYIRSMQTK